MKRIFNIFEPVRDSSNKTTHTNIFQDADHSLCSAIQRISGNNLCYADIMSRDARNPVFRVSDKVRHKHVRSLEFWILRSCLCRENKGADQLAKLIGPMISHI